MATLPVVKPKQVLKALQRAGIALQTGATSALFMRLQSNRRVTVHLHNKDLKKGTLRNILRQAELTLHSC